MDSIIRGIGDATWNAVPNSIQTLGAIKEHPRAKPSYGRWGTHIDAYEIALLMNASPAAHQQLVLDVTNANGDVSNGIENCIRLTNNTTIKIKVTPGEGDGECAFRPDTYYQYVVVYSNFAAN